MKSEIQFLFVKSYHFGMDIGKKWALSTFIFLLLQIIFVWRGSHLLFCSRLLFQAVFGKAASTLLFAHLLGWPDWGLWEWFSRWFIHGAGR